MKLSQKIKHIKRHKKNKKFIDTVCFIFQLAQDSYDHKVIVSPKVYYVMEYALGLIPPNVIKSSFLNDNDYVIVPIDLFSTDNEKMIYELSGIPYLLHKEPSEETVKELEDIPLSQFVNPELYMDMVRPTPINSIIIKGI